MMAFYATGSRRGTFIGASRSVFVVLSNTSQQKRLRHIAKRNRICNVCARLYNLSPTKRNPDMCVCSMSPVLVVHGRSINTIIGTRNK